MNQEPTPAAPTPESILRALTPFRSKKMDRRYSQTGCIQGLFRENPNLIFTAGPIKPPGFWVILSEMGWLTETSEAAFFRFIGNPKKTHHSREITTRGICVGIYELHL